MRKIRTKLLATAALLALSGSAYAADLGQPVYKAPPPPPPVQDWSGVYVGLEGGYGWGKQDFNPAFNFFGPSEIEVIDPPVNPTISSVNQSGGVFGGFAGVQKQWGSWVLGLEAEVDWADINGTTTATTTNSVHPVVVLTESPDVALTPKTLTQTETESINSKIDEVGYVGPKVGWAFSPNWMVYATGGVAWAHKEDNASETLTQTCSPGSFTCSSFDSFMDSFGPQSGGISMFGYAVGGGLDYKWQLDAGSAVILGVKYLHYGFGNDTLTLVDNQNTFAAFSPISFNTKESLDIVTGRISWLFSIH
jgi:outer membrane immunogenic protein